MKRLLFAFAVLVLLAGCLPNLNTLEPPQLTLEPEGAALVRLDPPGVGEAEAVFRFKLRVKNPNPFRVRLVGLEGAFFLNGRRAPGSSIVIGAVSLPAQSESPLELTVRAPLREGSPLLADLAGLLAGRPTSVHLAATPILAFGKLEQSLPSQVRLTATLEHSFALQAPRLSIDTAASGLVAASSGNAIYRVVLKAENSGPLGFVFAAQGLALTVAGERVASVGPVRAPLPARSMGRVIVQFKLSGEALEQLAAGVVEGIRGDVGGISVAGGFRLELPGITALTVAPRVLVSGGLEGGSQPE